MVPLLPLEIPCRLQIGKEQQRRAEAGGKTGEPARERHIHAAGRRQRERQMCGGRKAARSAAAIGERREIERGETERRKQQKLHIEMPQHAVARVGAVGDDELHARSAQTHRSAAGR